MYVKRVLHMRLFSVVGVVYTHGPKCISWLSLLRYYCKNLRCPLLRPTLFFTQISTLEDGGILQFSLGRLRYATYHLGEVYILYFLTTDALDKGAHQSLHGLLRLLYLKRTL